MNEQGTSRQGHEDILSVLEAAPVGMIKVDLFGKILLTNRELERMFQYTRQELLGASLELLIPQRYHKAHAGHMRSFSAAPSTRAMGAGRELFGRRRDGTEFPIDVALNHVHSESERSVIASVIDSTEQRRAKAELERLNASLEQKNSELERFVFTVSHDLKAPIVTILGYLGHLRKDLECSRYTELPEFAARIQSASERMRHKIDDLLKLSRIGRESSAPQQTRVQDVLDAVIRDHDEELTKRGIQVHTRLEAKTLWCNPQHFEQVIENLLGNAIRYGATSADPQIEVWTQPTSDGGVELGVDDNGVGIDARHAEKIFELFQRLSTDGDGTGVGLAIVRRIAHWYGGKAWVEPAPGNGGKFRMRFPPAKAAEIGAATKAEPNKGGTA